MIHRTLLSLSFVALAACSATGPDVPPPTNHPKTDDAGATADPTPTTGDAGAPAPPKRVFVTSKVFTADLGGVAGADAKCATAAQAAMLGGTWKAWISSSTTSAIDRIADVGPWYLVDGKRRVFNNKANLLTAPLAPISLDEMGHDWTQSYYGAWTGTTDQGTSDGSDDCLDWTSADDNDWVTTGGPQNADQTWGGGQGPYACSRESALICFEQ